MEQVLQNVIDCWATILNYNENKTREKGSRRLFCYSTTIPQFLVTRSQTKEKALSTLRSRLREVLECDDELLDLRAYNIIIIPLLKNNHFYLVCFDLDNATVEVIDNMFCNKGFYSMKVGTRFSDVGTHCKVKNYMIGYLENVGHTSAIPMTYAELSKRKIEWTTRDNYTDCGVFDQQKCRKV